MAFRVGFFCFSRACSFVCFFFFCFFSNAASGATALRSSATFPSRGLLPHGGSGSARRALDPRTMSDPLEIVTVDSLRPGLSNLNLVVKILEATEVLNKKHPDGSSTTIVECVAGDATGTVIFSARNKQAEACKPGVVLRITNGKIDMFNGTMRLAEEKGGSVKPTEEQEDVDVNTGYDLSAVEYELISDNL